MLGFSRQETIGEGTVNNSSSDKKKHPFAVTALSVLGAGTLALGLSGCFADVGLKRYDSDNGTAEVPKCPPDYREDLPEFSAKNWYPTNVGSRFSDFKVAMEQLRELIDPDRKGIRALEAINPRYRDLARKIYYPYEVYAVTPPLVKVGPKGVESRFDDPSEVMCERPNGEGALNPAAEGIALGMLDAGVDIRLHGYSQDEVYVPALEQQSASRP